MTPEQKREVLDTAVREIVRHSAFADIPLVEFRDWLNYRMFQHEAINFLKADPNRTPEEQDEDVNHTLDRERDELIDTFVDDPQPEEIINAFALGEQLDPAWETPILQLPDFIKECYDACKKTSQAE